jgi:tetratricopeptide (TPR) repeat protein
MYCHEAMVLMDEMGIQDTIPYATTLLNAANGFRAAGLLQESLELYNKVKPIYEAQLSENDMYFAGLYNNLSLLYQELGDFHSAKEYLESALVIVMNNADMQFEVAVTQANLANTCIELGQYIEAKDRAIEAVRIFEEIGVDDAHYSAALAALGSLYYMEMDYPNALETMKKSRECVAKYLGDNNIQCQRLDENIRLIQEKMQASQEKADEDFDGDFDEDLDEEIPTEAQIPDEAKEETAGETADELPPEITGLELCRMYYENYGKTMISEKFWAYESRIATGLVGKGSDCFGFDDIQSRDHDFGPRFCMWVTKEVYDEIGAELEEAYEALPDSYMGIKRIETFHGKDRAGVMIIEDFYKDTIGTDLIGMLIKNDSESFSKESIDSIKCWLLANDYALAAAVNGEVFRDDEGIFTKYRKKLMEYYPKAVWYRKLAQACGLFSQNGQYNLPRMRNRGQLVAAELAKSECIKQAMKLDYMLNKKYAPHDKWLFKALPDNPGMVINDEGFDNEGVASLIERISATPADKDHENELTRDIESLAVIFANELERQDIIGKCDLYLDANTNELTAKSDALLTAIAADAPVVKTLSLSIAKAEFEAFDKVQNEGGRASCQNNWPTFKVMRMSQYMTWNEDMLLQYLYEFKTNFANGRNLIEEKYARMMESTAPDEYKRFADKLVPVSDEKKKIIEQIVAMQVKWMEEFASKYPKLAGNARLIHTSEDLPYDTSYETYLRGELGTYSDRMIDMYGRYIVEHANNGVNVAEEIMGNTIHFYGYKDFETAEKENI